MPRGAHADRSASASETLAPNDDYEPTSKTLHDYDHATGASPKAVTKMSSEKDKTLKPSKKQTDKKKKGFWARLWACFTPKLNSDQLDDDAHVGRSPGNSTLAANSSAKRIDDEGNSNKTKNTNKTTEETMVQSPPTHATSNGASPTHDGANGSQPPSHHQQPPHLAIPTPSVIITAPSTPQAYNTFDLDSDPDIVIPPTPSKASHLLPQDETEGVTSGAVQAPGGIAHGEKDETDRGTFTDDEFHDAKEEDDIDAEEMRLIMNAGSGIPIVNGEPRPLLPPLAEHHRGRKCLVLDMDETLLHSSFKLMPQHDFTVPVEIEWQWHNAYVLKRPGVEEFLRRMGEIYEVIVYTASVSKYADPVLDKVDVHKAVSHRLFRESCYNHRGNYVKDLSMLGRPLEQCIILDNSPASYLFNPTNAVPVTTWFNDPLDTELPDLIGFLTDLANVPDVRPLLARDC